MVLRAKFADTLPPSTPPPVLLPQNTLGIPSPSADTSFEAISPIRPMEQKRQPPPYRPPPPVTSPSPSLDNISISSSSFSFRDVDDAPQAPPRKKSMEKSRAASMEQEEQHNDGEQVISVKERTQKFNRLASVDNELVSPSQKDRKRPETVRFCFLLLLFKKK